MHRLRQLDPRVRQGLIAGWVLLLLALPAVLWLVGSRQPILESRAKVPFPAFNRSTLTKEQTFRDVDTALLDRFPGRDKALNLHSDIALDLFHDSPNPDVAIGTDGYYYYVPELTPCRPGGGPSSDPADAVDVLARTLVAARRTTAVTVVPSKLFAHASDAPTIDGDAERCAADIEDRVQERLARVPGGLALGPAQRAAEDAGESTFLRTDTHWNWRGREIYVRRLLNRIRPGLAHQTRLRAGREIRRPTDLNVMLGRPGDESDRAVEVERTPSHPFPAGSVVLIGDSQMDFSMIRPFGDGVRSIRDTALPGAFYCDWGMLSAGYCNEAISRARVIAIEKVARDIGLVTSLCWLPIALVGEQLNGPPADWERVDGGDQPSGPLELPASGAVSVRVRPPGTDAASSPRLLRIPLEHVPTGADGRPVAVTMTQAPQAGPPAPCAMPSQAVEGGSLFLPVPAGRRASDLVVQLQGAPGTRIGRPRVVPLDDEHLRGRTG